MNLNKYFLRNKKNNIMFIVLIICLNFIVCCKSSNNNVLIKTYSFYKQAQKKLKEKKFNDAIFILETIKKNKIANFIDDKIYINLIYAYYKKSDLNMAQKTLEKFIRIYPNHPNIDYVIYMQSLIKISMDKNIFFTYFPINYNKNDTYYAQSAFFELKYLINQYPKSLYVVNAKKHLIALKYRLSEHDFKILKFYFLNKEYIAVVNRGEEILQKYPETPAARKALIYIEKSYFALKIFDTAQKISKIISLNEI